MFVSFYIFPTYRIHETASQLMNLNKIKLRAAAKTRLIYNRCGYKSSNTNRTEKRQGVVGQY